MESQCVRKGTQYNVFYYRCTILFDRDGNTISSAGEWQSSDEDICAAVAANIWLTLERASRGNPNQVIIIQQNSENRKVKHRPMSMPCLIYFTNYLKVSSGGGKSGSITPGFLEFAVHEFDSGLLGVAR